MQFGCFVGEVLEIDPSVQHAFGNWLVLSGR